MTDAPAVHPLVTEAMRKAALIWLELPGHPTIAAWTVWHSDAAYVVHGGDEQPLPGLAEATACRVLVRSAENGARIVAWPAVLTRVEPGSEEWAAVVPQLLAKRLNLPQPNSAEERWAAESIVTRIAPAGDPDAELPDDSHAAPPMPTPAATPARIPRTLHRPPRKR